MTTDTAFELALYELDFANKIWETNDKARFHLAESAYKRAVELRNTYFPDEPNAELTEDTPF
jgi:hypothetical protein